MWNRSFKSWETMSYALAVVRHRARLGHGVAQRAKPEGRE